MRLAESGTPVADVCRQIGVSEATYKREGWAVGKKRVYRLYRLEGLQLRMKLKRRKRISLQRGRVMPATAPNEHWSMDFVHDQMLDGRAFRILTVIDQWSRESVSLEANFRLTGRCVGQALDQAALERGWPKVVGADIPMESRPYSGLRNTGQ